jgi:branched-subunit amino acid aminotransferase/4-amino-4-deoxychorismate lyase
MHGYAEHCFLNGNIIPMDEAFIHPNDLAVMRGYGVFDFFRRQNSTGLFVEDYLERFIHSASALRLSIDQGIEELQATITILNKKNDLEESGVRLILTGGITPNGYSIRKPNFMIFEEHLNLPAKKHFVEGVKLMTHEYQREIPTVKSINYLVAIYLVERARELGAYDILYHQRGRVREVTRSNFFMVTKQNTLVTSKKGVLFGITRKKVLDLAKKKFKIEERDYSLDELYHAKEAFLTGTTKKIMPVVQVDDRVISEQPGEVTLYLMHELDELINEEIKRSRR